MSKIYVASSWRNDLQPHIVEALRDSGHEVYDFRHPEPGNDGFRWSALDEHWLSWTPRAFIDALNDPIAIDGFTLDRSALDWCDTCVLVLPCGRSAHLEAGYAVGRGKRTIGLLSEVQFEPELMYRFFDRLVTNISDLIAACGGATPTAA